MTHSAIQPEAANDIGKMRALKDFWFYFSVNRGAVIGLYVFMAVILVAILAPVIAPHSPVDQFRDYIKLPPFWQEGGSTQFLLGTDEVGRDILSRLIYGAQYSLLVGFVIVIISMCLGITIGLITGYFGGGVDTVFMRIMDVILAFPSLLLALVLVAILGPGLINAVLAITLVLLPHFSRLTRAAVMAEKEREYVTAAKLAGASRLRLMFKTILPNCLAPLVVQATMSFSNAILDVAALGFLGMGAQPPTPEWGTMLASAREFITSAWWIVTFPGLAILITVLAINLIGDGLRDALDPKLKRS
ncbi:MULTISPECIES: ABC transporter permease subunit [Brucella/Ochrobactrum group]|uniref:ABC transporter permease subunit n=3 Tax=Brucella/Ochrobactrum group TaxID=2826938 RepID=A0ABD5JYU7_9HYPH|nr:MULTISPECIES: ABC transporter permease subunit [Brucella/Ochrobactrum group]MCH4541721.1 ABC transporter permease subunit [Ochrobactrum sp. A-1]MCI1000263.1 ABC transporter permease subunit [Ochrobactrum sp. C6C9]RRD25040.1 ABC transporter permease subunit [Brucellaceae bacterium VT-16-1752]WHT42059.1 ABC transporter permease subunit [Ochrobactrum sp. SSR]MBR7651545.1 ABC transporter permease subunit [Brucella oryzae]